MHTTRRRRIDQPSLERLITPSLRKPTHTLRHRISQQTPLRVLRRVLSGIVSTDSNAGRGGRTVNQSTFKGLVASAPCESADKIPRRVANGPPLVVWAPARSYFRAHSK